MYNYKISEFDLADLMMYQMTNDKKIKKFLDICTIMFSVSIVMLLMFIIKIAVPEINLIFLALSAIILGSILIMIIFKNYRWILAKVFRRDVIKKSDKYDITLSIQGRKLMVYSREEEEDFDISEITCKEIGEASYAVIKRRVIIIPHRIFKSQEEKVEFFKKL